MEKTQETNPLANRFNEFRAKNPTTRIRDAAVSLDVSEGELLASTVGRGVARLNDNFKEMFMDLDSLGRVMALTRNEHIVHERKGIYSNAQAGLPHGMALFVNADIDLRIFTNRWKFGFAADVENARGIFKSLQFFDNSGTAIHKIYLTAESDLAAYVNFVQKYMSDIQLPYIAASKTAPQKADRDDLEIDVDGINDCWSEMKDTHDFFPMLQSFGVGRKQALRLVDERFSQEVAPDSYKFVLETARDRKIPIMVFVGNNGIIQIHTGEIENVVEARGWFNVMDKEFNLHINQSGVDSAFVVRKPTIDGIVTSVELFDAAGKNIALIFGKRKPGIPEREDWRGLILDLLKTDGTLAE